MLTFTAVVTAHAESPHRILGNLMYQTRKPDEIICLISDFPLEELERDFPTVTFYGVENHNDWGHQKRWEGLEYASGDWVGFFNSDDTYDMTYLEKMLGAAESEEAREWNVGAVYCSWNTIPDCTFNLGSSTSGNFIVNTHVAREAGYTDRHYEADGTFIERVRNITTAMRVNDLLYYHNVAEEPKVAQQEYIGQRWRKPSTPFAVRDSELATGTTGRPQLDYEARWSPEDIERRKQGYVCIECWEPHETPFPERCQLCGFPMRAKQLEQFEKQFKGVERNPRAALIASELDRIDDVHERNFHEPKLGLVFPKGV